MRRPRRGLLVSVDEWPWWLAGEGIPIVLTPLEPITLRVNHQTRTLQVDHSQTILDVSHQTRTLKGY